MEGELKSKIQSVFLYYLTLGSLLKGAAQAEPAQGSDWIRLGKQAASSPSLSRVFATSGLPNINTSSSAPPANGKLLHGTGEHLWAVRQEFTPWIFALAPPQPGQDLMWPRTSNSPNEGLGKKQIPRCVAAPPAPAPLGWTGAHSRADPPGAVWQKGGRREPWQVPHGLCHTQGSVCFLSAQSTGPRARSSSAGPFRPSPRHLPLQGVRGPSILSQPRAPRTPFLPISPQPPSRAPAHPLPLHPHSPRNPDGPAAPPRLLPSAPTSVPGTSRPPRAGSAAFPFRAAAPPPPRPLPSRRARRWDGVWLWAAVRWNGSVCGALTATPLLASQKARWFLKYLSYSRVKTRTMLENLGRRSLHQSTSY